MTNAAQEKHSTITRRAALFGLAVAGAALMPATGPRAAGSGKAAAQALPVGEISVQAALARARSGEVIIVDVRSPQEWMQTGLPQGARPVTIHDPAGLPGFVKAMTAAVDGDLSRPVALICARGNRSTLAQNALQAAGFTQVLNVKEGMFGSASGPGWLARDLPLEPCRVC